LLSDEEKHIIKNPENFPLNQPKLVKELDSQRDTLLTHMDFRSNTSANREKKKCNRKEQKVKRKMEKWIQKQCVSHSLRNHLTATWSSCIIHNELLITPISSAICLHMAIHKVMYITGERETMHTEKLN
jgi:hypothetical protein